MGRTSNLRSVLIATAVAAMFPLACSSSSSSATPDGGSSSSNNSKTSSSNSKTSSNSNSSSQSQSNSQSSSSKPMKDSGVEDAPKSMTDGGGGDAAACPASGLYARLGGHAGIYAAVGDVVTEELMNPDIASYFFFQGEVCPKGKDADVAGACTASAANATKAVADGHPTAAQIQECFTDLVGQTAGGTETYPTKVTIDGGGSFTCRNLTTAHKALKINEATFSEFIMIAAGVLQPALKVADATCATKDFATLAGALEGLEGNVVSVDGGPFQAFPGSVDAALQLDGTY